MYNNIPRLSWHSDMWKQTIEQEDIDDLNRDIDFYNALPEGEEKKMLEL